MENYIGYLRIFWNSSGYRILFAGSLIYLVMHQKDDKKWKTFTVYTIGVLVLVFNPLSAHIIGLLLKTPQEHVRVWYLVPVSFAIAAVFTNILLKYKERKKILWILGFIVVIFTGECFYFTGAFHKAENIYKIPDEVIEICEILENAGEEQESIDILIYKDELYWNIRKYTNKIKIVEGLPNIESYKDRSVIGIERVLNEWTEKAEFNYIVVENYPEMIDKFLESGCELTGSTEHYVVLKYIE